MNARTVKLGGKEREVRFGVRVIGDCIKHFDQDPSAFMVSLSSNPFHSIPALFYYGMVWAVERNNETPDFTFADVYDWLEEAGLQSKEVDAVVQAFIRSLYDNVPAIKELIDQQDEESKKKLIGTET